MRKVLKVAQREYVEVVKTRTFLMGVLMTPLLILVVWHLGQAAERETTGPRPPRKVAVADLSGQLRQELAAVTDAHNAGSPQRRIALEYLSAEAAEGEALQRQKERIRQGALDALVVIEPGAVAGEAQMRVYTCGTSVTVLDLGATVESLVNKAVVNQRYKLHNLSPELLAELRRSVPAEQVDVGLQALQERSRRAGDDLPRLMVPYFFMFLMFMGIFGSGQQLLSSIIEEKNSRVIEVLLSALSPFELMAGKILGLAGTSLTVVGLWAAAAAVSARWKGLNVAIPAEILPYFVIYYVLGFLLFSSILAGLGSICNTLKEAQGLMMPLSVVLILPMVGWFYLVQNPDGLLAKGLSFLPPLTPMVMILRLSANPHLPMVEVVGSIIVLGASVPGAMWAAAKVFRIGILLYGKRPALTLVWRWVWHE